LALLLCLGLFLTNGLMNVLIPKSWMANDTTAPLMNGSVNTILVLLAAGIFGPIAEETAFRGLMMTRLLKGVAPWLAIAVTALAFSVFHGIDSFGHIFQIVPFAVCIGLAFYWTRSLRITIMIHVIYNSASVLIGALMALAPAANAPEAVPADLQKDIIIEGLVLGLFGVAVDVLALVLIYRQAKKSRQTPAVGPYPNQFQYAMNVPQAAYPGIYQGGMTVPAGRGASSVPQGFPPVGPDGEAVGNDHDPQAPGQPDPNVVANRLSGQ